MPTTNVSIVDLVVDLKKLTSMPTDNASLQKAANGIVAGILNFCEAPLVSSDFHGNPAPSVVDALSTTALKIKMVKVRS